MNHLETYVGAYLKLTNIYGDTEVESYRCPNHGDMSNEFCPKCGSKKEKYIRIDNVIKWIIGDKCEWVDKMVMGTKKSHAMYLMPNQINCGGMDNESDGEKIIDLSVIDQSIYINILQEKYKDYIKWLKEVRGFEITVHFGVIQYWN
jgi:hypothetical protein